MYSRVLTSSLMGLEGSKTWVEVNSQMGLPSFSIVGLANQSVKESKDRILSAISNSGLDSAPRKITVNLTPANSRKDGTHYDLPIALALIMSNDSANTGEYDNAVLKGEIACIGELRLDGSVAAVDGALPMIIGLQNEGVEKVIIPEGNLNEAMLVKGMMLYPVKTLIDAVDLITGKLLVNGIAADGKSTLDEIDGYPDFEDIRGQEFVKRAACIAAAGMHGMLMIGPPGVGKSMVGKRIPGILPPLSYKEQLDITQIYSVAGKLSNDGSMISSRPFRSPHHSMSATALVGGGANPKPGEISLAHNGVLFLDELPEFQSKTLDMLRQPLEDGEVTITRVHGKVVYPSRFMLVAAMNPCRCGYYGDPIKPCTCTETDRIKYLGKVSGPLLDRIDIHVAMERIVYSDITGKYSDKKGTNTKTLRENVIKAFEIQKERYKDLDIDYNSQLYPKLIDKYCKLDSKCDKLMEAAFAKWNLSARSYHRILKVARTVADICGSTEIREEHILEALSYRMPEKYFK